MVNWMGAIFSEEVPMSVGVRDDEPFWRQWPNVMIKLPPKFRTKIINVFKTRSDRSIGSVEPLTNGLSCSAC